MDSDFAINISHVSKRYVIGVQKDGSLAGTLSNFIGSKSMKAKDEFWALKDVSFEIKKGDVIGIIGKNGAGKSTLLKILSQITKPTEGTIEIDGRIASLLEVGTGFHPELTGRENIYLNGTILGMTRKEVKDKFDEIVAFSGVEKFIDTPVKHYSSGMYVRLAFAVAAHLEPEILIIDEVLAVGDAEFQQKCLGKMKEVSAKGRTVLFVSHNMAAVKSLCNKAILLQNGSVLFKGSVSDAVHRYMTDGIGNMTNMRSFEDREFGSQFKLNKIAVYNLGKTYTDPIVENEKIIIETEIIIHSSEPERLSVTFHMINELGETLFSFGTSRDKIILKQGLNKLKTHINEGFLQSSNFSLHLFIVEDRKRSIFSERDIASFSVVNAERDLGVYMGKEPGFIKPSFHWEN